MGFDANRRYRDDKSNDIWILVAAIVLIGAAILWAVGIL
jgi:hypothetical protein